MPSQSVLTTDQLVSQIASSLQISKPVVRALLQELAKTAIREFKKNGFFVLPGIGRLVRSHRMARMGRNPRTGEAIKIPAPAIAKFHVDAGFAKLIQGSSLDRTLTSAGDDVELKKKAVLQPKASNQGKPKYEVVRIFYATDREAVPGKRLKFSSRRNDSGNLSLGTCDVSIPRDHRVGNIERPSILRIEFRENPDKHFVIQSITTKEADDFYDEMSQCVGISQKKEAFIFIHGFKVAFDDAIYRTAQMSHDLQFKGAPILYSWPSNGKLYDYTPDINNNDWTVDHLETFLKDVVARSGAKVIHLIAHSMGNRALTSALKQMSATRKPGDPEFNQIVLTAPDVDADIFTKAIAAIRALARRVTLYASTRDLALLASKKKNGTYPRAGDCGKKVVVTAGLDTIDASAVDTNFIGHFYYAENRSVLSDIFNLFDGGRDPDQRFGIREVTAIPPYWRFAP